MPVLFDRTCILCGRVLPAEKHSAALCPDCAREVRTEYRYHGEFSVPGADGAAAALCYRGTVKEALHRFKFGGRPQYAAWFAAEMAAVLAAQLDRWQPTCITYLPLGFLRARERGYNQAELLARPIAQSLSMRCASVRLPPVSPCSGTLPPAGRMPPARSCPDAFRSQASASWSSTISSRPARPPQTPRMSCAAWAPPVFSCSRPQKP